MQALSTNTGFDTARVPAFTTIVARGAAPRADTGQNAARTIDELGREATRLSFGRNRVIYFEGDPADYYYRVVSGTVRLCKETEDGRRQIAGFPGPGDLFGWAGSRHNVYSAEAVTDVVILRWHRRTIEDAIARDPDAGHRMLSVLFEQLAEAQNHLLLLGRMHADERVATFLLSRAERNARNGLDAGRILLGVCRKDIADYLGLTVETVSRTMHAFKNRGVVSFAAGEAVKICDRPGLERLAGGLAN